MNQFLEKSQSKNCYTWNGAVSHSTSGDSILDYFAKAGSYRNRTQAEVDADMASIFGEDEELALKVMFYNRMITRKCKGFVEETSLQKGQGQKDEFLKSLRWLEANRPELLQKNLWLTAEVGSWKDLVNAYVEHDLNQDLIFPLLKDGIEDSYHRALVAKFLPKIRSKSNSKNDRHKALNDFARNFAGYMGWSEKEYRKFKSDPENSAHQYQRDICNQNWASINLNSIPGKALLKMVSGKGRDQKSIFERHGLESKLEDYVKSNPVKFNGFPYELYQKAMDGRNYLQKLTYDAQFQTLLEKAKDECSPELLSGGVLCALDTSGSMSCNYWSATPGTPAPIDVCVGLGLYFSNLIEGHFKNHVCMFDDSSRIVKLNGSFCDQVDQIHNQATAWGGTNFQSVIDEIVRVRTQNPNIPVEDFPKTLLVVSDMQFNPSGNTETNHETAMRKLANVGLPEMSVIWWNVNGRFTKDVPSKMDDRGTILISGFDGAILSSFFSKDEESRDVKNLTPLEAMHQALDQEILNLVET